MKASVHTAATWCVTSGRHMHASCERRPSCKPRKNSRHSGNCSGSDLIAGRPSGWKVAYGYMPKLER